MWLVGAQEGLVNQDREQDWTRSLIASDDKWDSCSSNVVLLTRARRHSLGYAPCIPGRYLAERTIPGDMHALLR